MDAVMKFRRMYTLLKENEMLIRIGAYTQGTDKELDEAIRKKEAMEGFLKQRAEDVIPYEQTVQSIVSIINS
jgi:flagellum-specific ATP synthase